jgi:SAM-dependent methyltransferase
MSNVLSDPKTYSQKWMQESNHFEKEDIYKTLTQIIPKGNFIEFGCGVGNGTYHLATKGNVLALDNNEYLINEASKKGFNPENSVKIHKCDFFEITDEDKKIIKDFSPTVIVGWFIGSNGQDIFKRTKEESNPYEKGKLYREKIEDIIISKDICLESIEYIHLANRGFSNADASEEELFLSTKQDYDTHVFKKIGFEVVDVKSINWDMTDSEFQYSAAHNPNFKAGKIIPTVTSILAKRTKS